MADFDFDVSSYEAKEFSLIDAGEYDAIIIASEKKHNKNSSCRSSVNTRRTVPCTTICTCGTSPKRQRTLRAGL